MITLLIDSLKISKVVICGHSLGGLVMYNYGFYYPERCQGFIYMAAPPRRMYLVLGVFDAFVRSIQEKYTTLNNNNVKKLDESETRINALKDITQLSKGVYF